jgi:hypothetical protein
MVPVDTLQSIFEDPSKGSKATQYFPFGSYHRNRESKTFIISEKQTINMNCVPCIASGIMIGSSFSSETKMQHAWE